ncbi:MAG: hypothetical protein FXV80_00435 [Candidatus Thioglobus sp.]|nr:MAG: hypothetical protein FXV80_00435 [Candidatus Thioglobus sp.]
MIDKLREIHREHRITNGNVSAYTRSAITITKEWQDAVCNKTIRSEVKVSPSNNEKIDIVDRTNRTAYELKVSGKNAHHEFFKDLVKALTYNINHEENQLQKLVFISEDGGIESLKKRIDPKFLEMIEKSHKLSVELISI